MASVRPAHPDLNGPYTEPRLSADARGARLPALNGFKTFIVSAGGVEFMRPWAEPRLWRSFRAGCGFARSRRAFRSSMAGAPSLFRLAEIDFVDDKAGKPVRHQFEHIGRRPIAAFGNCGRRS